MRELRMFPGQRYNRWTTIKLAKKEPGKYWWLCKCDCGTERLVRSGDLVNDKSKSCGCLQTEHYKDFSVEEAFQEKVEKTDGCWIWLGAKTPNGYGVFQIKGKHIYAHRYSYELETGKKIPKGLDIDHLCRHHSCVNPRHLEPVTRAENVWRGVVARRRNMCVKGLHPMTGRNVYINPTTGKSRCRRCRDEYRRKYWLEKQDNRGFEPVL